MMVKPAAARHALGLFTQQLLRLWIMHQNLVQVLLIQNEEVRKAMSDDVCCSAISPPCCQQAARDTARR